MPVQTQDPKGPIFNTFFIGRSTYDVWLNAAAFEVSQVLFSYPHSFAQTGLASGILFQLLYAILGCWSCFLITMLYADYRYMREKQGFSFDNHVIQWYEILDGLLGPFWKVLGLISNIMLLFSASTVQIISCSSLVYIMNDSLPKRTWTFIFGALMTFILFPADMSNYRFWSVVNVIMTPYVSWYMTLSSTMHGQKLDVRHVRHTGPHSFHDYYTGASNFLYGFGGHALTVEFMHAMKEPKKFKTTYLYAVLYILTCTLPSAITVYWVHGDKMLETTNALAILPKSKYRSAAVVLSLLHQFPTFGVNALPIFLTWEKFLGIHGRSNILRIISRIPIFLVILFAALMLPFFGSINSVIGSTLTSFAVHIIPCAAFMATYRRHQTRKNAVDKLPRILSWTWIYCINVGIMIWIFVHAALGVWASIYNLNKSVHSFGLFAKCYEC